MVPFSRVDFLADFRVTGFEFTSVNPGQLDMGLPPFLFLIFIIFMHSHPFVFFVTHCDCVVLSEMAELTVILTDKQIISLQSTSIMGWISPSFTHPHIACSVTKAFYSTVWLDDQSGGGNGNAVSEASQTYLFA